MKEKMREGGRGEKGGKYDEGEGDRGRKGGREGGREGWREGGREERREGGREIIIIFIMYRVQQLSQYVIGYEKTDHFAQKINLRLQHIKVHSLRFLLQFVSLN